MASSNIKNAKETKGAKVKRDRTIPKEKIIEKEEIKKIKFRPNIVVPQDKAKMGDKADGKIDFYLFPKNENNDDDDMPPVDPEDMPSPEDEVIDIVAPSASAGLVIVKEKAKTEEKKAGSRKFLRVQQKIATKMDERQSVLAKQTANKNRSANARAKRNESSVDAALRVSSEILSMTSGPNVEKKSTIQEKSSASETQGAKVKVPKIKIAGMVDGLTPMEIARQKKSGFDALF